MNVKFPSNFNIIDFWKKRSVQLLTDVNMQTEKLDISKDSSGQELPTQEERLRNLVLSPNDLIGSRVTQSKAFKELKESYSENFINLNDRTNSIKLNYIQKIFYKALDQHFISANEKKAFQETSPDDAENASFNKEEFRVLYNVSLENFLADLYRRTYKFTENNYEELGLKGANSSHNVTKNVIKNLSVGAEDLDNRPKIMHLFHEAFSKALRFSSENNLNREESEHLIKERLDRIVPIIKHIEAIEAIDESEARIKDIKKKSILNMLILKNSALEHLEKNSELFTNIANKLDQTFTGEIENKEIFRTYNICQYRDDYIDFIRDIAKVYLHFATQTTKLNEPMPETLKVANKFTEIYPIMKAEKAGLTAKSLRSFLFQYLKTADLELPKDQLITEIKNSEAYKKRLNLQGLIPATDRKKSEGLKQYAQDLSALSQEERDILAVQQASEALMRLSYGLQSEKEDYMNIYLRTIIAVTNANRNSLKDSLEKEVKKAKDPALVLMGEHAAKVIEIMRGKHKLAENLNPTILAGKITDAFLERLKDVRIAPKAVLISERLKQYSKIAIPFLDELTPKVDPLFDVRTDKNLINCLGGLKMANLSKDKAALLGNDIESLHKFNNLLTKIALVVTFSVEKIESFIADGKLYKLEVGEKMMVALRKKKGFNEVSFLNDFFKPFSSSSDKFLPNLFKAREAFKEALSTFLPQKDFLGINQPMKIIDAKDLVEKTLYQFFKNNNEEITLNPANIPLVYSDGSTRELPSHDEDLDPFPEGILKHYLNKIDNYNYEALEPILTLFATEARLSNFTAKHQEIFPVRNYARNFLAENELNEFKLVAQKYFEAAENGDFYSESSSEDKDIGDFIDEHLKNNGQFINGLVDSSSDLEKKIKRYIVVARMLLACAVKEDGLVD
jgi:hypothetical protein